MTSGNCHSVTEIKVGPAETIGANKDTYTRHIIVTSKSGATFDLILFGDTLEDLAIKM